MNGVATLKENGTMNFNIVMPMSSADGYGYSGEELVRAAVQDHGANINVIAHDWKDYRYTADFVRDLERDNWADKEVLLVYFIPYAFHHFRNDFTIGMTMFETDEIPDVWGYFSMIPNGLIVPSKFNQHVFAKKVDRPIDIAPLGVNTDTYFMIDRAPTKVLTFLMAGLLHYRTGAEFAVRAFKQEFSRSENVRLILKTRKGFLDIGSETIDDPRIQVVNADYDRSDMLNLYHAADAFIACSRGEASGLTPREAMATGLPTIVTNWGGLTEIADEQYTYPISIDGLEPAPAVCSRYDLGITQGQPIGNFSKPSVTSLREAMRSIYEDREESKRRGFEAAMWVQREWSYTSCSRKWLEAIERIYDGVTE